MTPQLKFLRRVRIHGRECGAVARALHHEVKGSSLCQADLEKSSGSTNERKQMSTKTTFKRIALVVVSALGFGMSVAISPANAADTASFSVPVTSVTVITDESTYDTSNAAGAIFKIVLRNFGTTKTSQRFQTGETLTASVVGVPAGTAATAKTLAANAKDLALIRVTALSETATAGNPYSATSRADFVDAETSVTGSIIYDESHLPQYETTTADFLNTYYLRVVPNGNAGPVIDQGEYSIRLRLTSASNTLLVQDSTIKVRFVSSAIGAGLTLSAADVGSFAVGEGALSTYGSTKYLKATLADANGGRVITENTAGTVAVPSLTADIINEDGAVINGAGTLTAANAGASTDFGYSALTTAAATDANNQLKGNNDYGITAAASWLDTATTDASGGETYLRVRYGDKTATSQLAISNTAAGTATITVSAVGKSVLTDTTPFSVPLTTKSATFNVSGATAGNAVIWTPTWTGCATGDRSHTSATAVTTYADVDGNSSLTVTCANPTDATSVSVAVTGFTTGATSVVTWYASAAQTMSVNLNGAIVALKSANTFVATVTDRFGGPVAGVVLTPSVSTTGSNGSTTRTYTSVTTDANGQASYTLTDALAVAAGTDTVSFAHVTSGTAISSASSTITYAATAPAPTTLLVYSNSAGNATQSVSGVSNPVPSTGIYDSGTDEFDIVIARNNSRAIATTDADMLTLRVRALEGAAVTATASSGAFIRGAAGTAVTTRTLYGSSLGDVYFVVGSNQIGANTITFTSGSVTATAAFWVANTTANARFVTLTGPATATANGDLQNYKVSVTDRYGNPISGATLAISATGVAAFGGGATLQNFTTGAAGEFTFTGTSFTSAGGAGSFKAEMTNTGTDATSVAGYVSTTAVESTLAAGNSSATLAVTFAAGNSAATAAAEAASDAAAEAIDAANAATDAANLAAEAADAATVAAEEARDAADAATVAVEELATQVATLMSALKAQITTLANTVAKIAKKVKA